MEGFCRGCLIKYDDPVELLQYTEKNRRLFVYSTGLQVKRNDPFVFQLCKDCYVNMKQSCKFKKQCRATDKKFKYYLSSKDAGDTVDFCTFLKDNEDNFMFRFSFMGNYTPTNLKKEDDNASTCTSIGNFMTDILQGEEMPDTEARIIKEVIEEEADVLEDSLDSHWLQDDMSIDPDFGIDFNFSPFSTPHSVNRDHCYTPKRLSDQHVQNFMNVAKGINNHKNNANEISDHEKNINNITLESNEPVQTKENYDLKNVLDNGHYAGNLSQSNAVKNEVDIDYEQNYSDNENYGDFESITNNVPITDSLLEPPVQIDGNVEINHVAMNVYVDKINYKNYYIPNKMLEQNTDEINEFLTDNKDIKNKNVQCTIDRNLEEALKNNVNKEIPLEDLLASPTVFQGSYAPTTPTIDNIVYGVKLDMDNSNHKVGQQIENFQNVESDIKFDDFFNKDAKEYDFKLKIQPKEIKDEVELDSEQPDENTDIRYDLEDSYCKLCDKKYSNCKALKIHFVKIHKIKLPPSKVKRSVENLICDYCSKEYTNRRNFIEHIKRHMVPKPQYKCDHCKLTFCNMATLFSHLKTHIGKPLPTRSDKKQTGKKWCCSICGAMLSNSSNYSVHMKRHYKIYSFKCDVCNRGFFSKPEYTMHIRIHTGEKPFKCSECPRAFSRRYCLLKHVLRHTGEKPYECEKCHTKFIKKESMINHMKKSKRCAKNKNRYEVKPFECFFCHKMFVRRKNFINHQNTSSKCIKLKEDTCGKLE